MRYVQPQLIKRSFWSLTSHIDRRGDISLPSVNIAHCIWQPTQHDISPTPGSHHEIDPREQRNHIIVSSTPTSRDKNSRTPLHTRKQRPCHHRQHQRHIPRLYIPTNSLLRRPLTQQCLIMDIRQPPPHPIPGSNNPSTLRKPPLRPTTPPTRHSSSYIIHERFKANDT